MKLCVSADLQSFYGRLGGAFFPTDLQHTAGIFLELGNVHRSFSLPSMLLIVFMGSPSTLCAPYDGPLDACGSWRCHRTGNGTTNHGEGFNLPVTLLSKLCRTKYSGTRIQEQCTHWSGEYPRQFGSDPCPVSSSIGRTLRGQFFFLFQLVSSSASYALLTKLHKEQRVQDD